MTSHVPEAVSTGVAPLVGHVPSAQHLSLAISLPPRNQSELDNLLQQLYDPQSPSYHKFLSVQEFTGRFGPAEADYAAVLRFAQNNHLMVTNTASNRMIVDIEGQAANVESAFHITLGIYEHPTEDRTFYAPDREPSVALDIPLLHISGLDNYALPHAKNTKPSQRMNAPYSAGREQTRKGTGSGPGGQFIGSDMRAAYYGSGPLSGTGQSVGLLEYGGYEISDVKNFFKKVDEPLYVPIHGVSLNGAPLSCPPPACDDSEQVLDIEMAISLAPHLSQVVVYVGFIDVSIFNRMATDNTSKQLSCSWGWADDESSLDPIFEEMVAQGQSIFVASGDDGSADPADDVWPADDPFVTGVGGTDLNTTGPGGSWLSESGWGLSAGGPSKNGIPIPYYQLLPGVINSSNHGSTIVRNFPDVAAEANTNQYSCYDGYCIGGNGGTSYAAPLWAGFMAMANEQSLADGGTAVGFLNPMIYPIGIGPSYDTDFHDITKGSNGKFKDVTGFDLVTGWGSPNGANLIDALTSPRQR
jgi:subtilase family serine protease